MVGEGGEEDGGRRNSKFYKCENCNDTNMPPGDLKGLPDESFFRECCNEKIYKGGKCDNGVILPGDLSRLPDDFFKVVVFIDNASIDGLLAVSCEPLVSIGVLVGEGGGVVENENRHLDTFGKRNATSVALMVTQICQDYSGCNDNRYTNVSGEKDSNGMVKFYTLLIPSNVGNSNNYINLSVCPDISHVGMAEWLTHFADTKGPSGFVGSIPTPGVTFNFELVGETCSRFRDFQPKAGVGLSLGSSPALPMGDLQLGVVGGIGR